MKKKWMILLSFLAGILVSILVPILVLAHRRDQHRSGRKTRSHRTNARAVGT